MLNTSNIRGNSVNKWCAERNLFSS